MWRLELRDHVTNQRQSCTPASGSARPRLLTQSSLHPAPALRMLLCRSCSGFALVQGRLSRSCGMDLIVTAWPATETVLQHHHDVGTIALQYAIHNLPHNIKWVRPSNQMSVRKKFFFLQRSVCHWREIQDASIFIFSIIWTSLSSK